MKGNFLYHGLKKIALRLDVSVPTARKLIQDGRIRAFKLENSEKAPWCCTEEEISEDISNLPAGAVRRSGQ